MQLSYVDLLHRMTDLRALSVPPLPGERAGCVSSYERLSRYDEASGNYVDWDANDDGGGYERALADGSVVALELTGPGVIWRSWSAMPGEGDIRVYADGALVIERPFIRHFTHFGDDYAPMNVPDVCPRLSRGYNSYLPIPFQKHIRIELAPGWGRYYHFTYSIFPKDTALPAYGDLFKRPALIALAELDRVLHLRAMHSFVPSLDVTAHARATASLLAREGSGAIERMQIRLSDPSAAGRLIVKMFWDGEAEPSVCAPLCDFFGTEPDGAPFATYLGGCTGGVWYARWHMPFASGARIDIENLGDAPVRIEADFAIVECDDAADRLRFRAKFHRDDFTGLDAARFAPGGDRFPDWPVLRASGGAGRFCGMHLRILDRFAYPGGMKKGEWWFWYDGSERLDWWWGEGDEKFFVDGETFPSTFGTGSEDYVGYAWAADPPFALFDSAFAANSAVPLDGNGVTSVCRLHVCDNIPFQQEFDAYIEKYKANAWGDDGQNRCLYGATAFWYQAAGARDAYAGPTLEQLEEMT